MHHSARVDVTPQEAISLGRFADSPFPKERGALVVYAAKKFAQSVRYPEALVSACSRRPFVTPPTLRRRFRGLAHGWLITAYITPEGTRLRYSSGSGTVFPHFDEYYPK